jgi:hypothetical protein
MNPEEFRTNLIHKIAQRLEPLEFVQALWEGGSAANKTTDEFSDIDLNILASESHEVVFEVFESALNSVSEITHAWHEPKSIWPDLTQRIYFLKDSPKHFFADVALFPESAPDILQEFMQPERHGTPVVHFDKKSKIIPHPVDKEALITKQQQRFKDILGAFPVYKKEVLKELDRGNPVDAIAFYQGGLIKPLVELLGMLHRPFQFDFGLRYLKRCLPPEIFQRIERLLYVSDTQILRKNAEELETLFYETATQVQASLGFPS